MAAHEHRWVKIGEDDVVVLSARAIPGNETNVSRVIGGLYRAGAQVIQDIGGLGNADIIASVQRPDESIIDVMRAGAVSVSFLPPATSGNIIRKLAERQISASLVAE